MMQLETYQSFYSSSKSCDVNPNVRQFSVMVRTMLSGTPSEVAAWISIVTSTVTLGKAGEVLNDFLYDPVERSRTARIGSRLIEP